MSTAQFQLSPSIDSVIRDSIHNSDTANFIPPSSKRLETLAAADDAVSAPTLPPSTVTTFSNLASSLVPTGLKRVFGQTMPSLEPPLPPTPFVLTRAHPRIDLLAISHGGEFYDQALSPEYLDGSVTMFNCGGDCGTYTLLSGDRINEYKSRLANLMIHQNNPNTFDVMEKFSASQKQPYKSMVDDLYPAGCPSRFEGREEKRAHTTKSTDVGGHCKMYHPQTEKIYGLAADFQTEITMLQMRDLPKTSGLWALTGKNVYDSEVLDYMETHASHEDIGAIGEFIDILKEDLKTHHRIYLSDILFICRKLGFEYINIYDLSCRMCDIPPERLDELNRVEGNVAKRKSKHLGGRRTRKHNRNSKKRKTSKNKSKSRRNGRTR